MKNRLPFRLALGSVLAGVISTTAVVAAPAPKVVGGTPVPSASDYPWQIALIANSADPYHSQYCGGTLIADRWVLTAAHCFLPDKYPRTWVAAGITNLDDAATSGELVEVERWYVHDRFNEINVDNDIALLRLKTSINRERCGDRCQPIGLVTPEIEDDVMAPSTPAWVTGWGDTTTIDQDSFYPRELQVAELAIADCQANGFAEGETTDNMICAIGNGRDSCSGDSGGPLMVLDNSGTGTLLQAGITSWGTSAGCAAAGIAGVYTRVSRYIPWINSIMQHNGLPQNSILGNSNNTQGEEGKKGKKSGGSLEGWLLAGLAGAAMLRRRRRG